MSDKTDAWMPLWIGAYLADTQHLSRDEHGAYLLLLMAYWRAREPLLDDDKRLAAIVKATPAEWRRLRPVLAEFFTIDGGTWRQKRADAEIAIADTRKAKATAKAQAAAGARWKQSPSDAPSIAPSTPQALHEECPTPSPVLYENKETTEGTTSLLVDQAENGQADKPPGKGYAVPDCPYDAIVAAYATALPTLPQPTVVNESRRTAIRARWREVCGTEKFDREKGVDWFLWFFDHASKSAFLTGNGTPNRATGRVWMADFDWLLNPTNFARVIDGRYHHERQAR